jgi:hypothetical protein
MAWPKIRPMRKPMVAYVKTINTLLSLLGRVGVHAYQRFILHIVLSTSSLYFLSLALLSLYNIIFKGDKDRSMALQCPKKVS